MSQRVGGMLSVQVNGVIYSAKGAFDYDLGRPKRESVMSSNGKRAGYKETPKTGFVEGKVIDTSELDTNALQAVTSATVTLELANGKVLVWHDACYAGDGKGNTEEGEFDFRFEGDGEEVA